MTKEKEVAEPLPRETAGFVPGAGEVRVSWEVLHCAFIAPVTQVHHTSCGQTEGERERE